MPNPVIIKRFIAAARPLDIFPGPPPDFHLDANTITGVAAGGAVATWPDRSANGRDFTQGTGANQPTWQVNIQNGKPAVRFGAGKFMSNAALVSTQSWTLFLVLKNSVATLGFLFYQGDATNGYGPFVSTNRTIQCRNAGATVNSTDAAFPATNAEVWSASRNNTGPLLQLWVNRASQTLSDTAPAQGLPGTTGVIGGFAAGAFNWAGDIFECIGYSSVLSDAQRAGIENYLIRKYDIT
jgi:hypothetical protein